MLFRSNFNLETGALSFLNDNERILLFSPYIKYGELQKINQKHHIDQIVVRWEIRDLCLGVSDLELYDYCKKHNIKLFRNTKIHLKAFWNYRRSVFFGSANVTNKGLGEGGNWELNGLEPCMSFDDITYLNEILDSSEYVTDELYDQIKNCVLSVNLPTLLYPEIPTRKKKVDFFLLSQLPMYHNVGELYEVYLGKALLNDEELECAAHDLVLYKVPKGLSFEEFEGKLKANFNAHPFIISFKEHIKSQPSQSMNYGSVVRWISENTTTVPTPRNWEIKQRQIVNILYDWIVLFNDDFAWSIPGNRSQVIYYNR